MTGIAITEVDALSREQQALTRAIYEHSFGPGLRVPFGELVRPGELDRTFVMAVDDEPAGIAVVRRLRSVEWTFLRYFAIAGDRRSQGLGRELWRLLRQSLREHAWPAHMIFEVEDPGEATIDDEERVTRHRRIRFWTACGAELLPVPGYVLPVYTEAGVAEPMLLMAAAEELVPGELLRGLVLAIYTDRYGMEPEDPLVARALASVPRWAGALSPGAEDAG